MIRSQSKIILSNSGWLLFSYFYKMYRCYQIDLCHRKCYLFTSAYYNYMQILQGIFFSPKFEHICNADSSKHTRKSCRTFMCNFSIQTTERLEAWLATCWETMFSSFKCNIFWINGDSRPPASMSMWDTSGLKVSYLDTDWIWAWNGQMVWAPYAFSIIGPKWEDGVKDASAG